MWWRTNGDSRAASASRASAGVVERQRAQGLADEPVVRDRLSRSWRDRAWLILQGMINGGQ